MITVHFEGQVCEGRTQWKGERADIVNIVGVGVVIADVFYPVHKIIKIEGWAEATLREMTPVSVELATESPKPVTINAQEAAHLLNAIERNRDANKPQQPQHKKRR